MKDEHKNLFQAHHQFSDRTEFVSQKEIASSHEMKEWEADVQKRFPLPKDACWLVCNWDSKYFVKTGKG